MLPNAPKRPVTVNGGQVMNSWYDIHQAGEWSLRPDMEESGKMVCDLIDEYKVDVVGGFSQGGAISLLVAYSIYPKTLSGVVGLSCYAISFTPIPDRTIPTFLYHGASDPMVNVQNALFTYEKVLNIPK